MKKTPRLILVVVLLVGIGLVGYGFLLKQRSAGNLNTTAPNTVTFSVDKDLFISTFIQTAIPTTVQATSGERSLAAQLAVRANDQGVITTDPTIEVQLPDDLILPATIHLVINPPGYPNQGLQTDVSVTKENRKVTTRADWQSIGK